MGCFSLPDWISGNFQGLALRKGFNIISINNSAWAPQAGNYGKLEIPNSRNSVSLFPNNYYFNSISHTKIIIGSILSGIGESVVVTTGLFLIGFNFAEIIALANSTGLGSTTLIGIWVFSVGKNIVMSFFGAVFAFGFIKSKFL